MMKLFQTLSLLIFVAVAACNDAAKKEPASPGSKAVTLDKVKLTDLNGSRIDLSLYKGKTVFINFWATWCRPCVAEMPSLQRMTEKLRRDNIVFLFASEEAPGEIELFKKAKDYTLSFVKAEGLMDLNITVLPVTFIFGRNGNLAFSEMGAREWDTEESISLITKIISQK